MEDREHIIAYRVNGKMVCEDCVQPPEIISLLGKERDIIMSSDEGEFPYFCERCKKQITKEG